MFDTETRSWTTLPMMPCKRSYGGVIWDTTGRLCLLGGLRQGGGHQSSKFTKNVNIFDTNQGMEIHFPCRFPFSLFSHLIIVLYFGYTFLMVLHIKALSTPSLLSHSSGIRTHTRLVTKGWSNPLTFSFRRCQIYSQ